MRPRSTLPILFPVLYYCAEVAAGIRASGGYPLPLWYLLSGLALTGVTGCTVLVTGRWIERVSTRAAVIFALVTGIAVVVIKVLWLRPTGYIPIVLVLVSPLLTVLFARWITSVEAGNPTIWYTLVTVLIVAGTGLVGTFAESMMEGFLAALPLASGWASLIVLVELASHLVPREDRFPRFHFLIGFLTIAVAGATIGYWAHTHRSSPWEFDNPYEGPELNPSPEARNSLRTAPNLLVISLDTLRRDAVTNHPDRLPNLTELRRDSIIFKNVFSTASWTLPAHASFFTGRLPVKHGAVIGAPTPINSSVPSYTQYLRRLGYRTAAFTGGGPVHGDLGFSRGFERYEHQVVEPFVSFVPGALEYVAWFLHDTRYRFPCSLLEGRERPSGAGHKLLGGNRSGQRHRYFSRSLRRARDWLRDRKDEPDPWFLFLHTYEIHDYYALYPENMERLKHRHPRQWESLERLRRNPSGSVRPLDSSEVQPLLNRRRRQTDPRMAAFYDRINRWSEDFSRMNPFKRRQFQYLLQSRPPQWNGLRNLYHYGIESVDRSLGKFLSFLQKNGQYDSTLIVLLSDHGEGFALDSGVVWHSLGQVDTELLRIPLWMKLPGQRQRVRTERAPFQIHQVLPMTLDALNVPPRKETGLPKFTLANPLRRSTVPGIPLISGSTKSHLSEGPNFFVRGRGYKLVTRYRGDSGYRKVHPDRMDERPVGRREVPERIRQALEKRLRALRGFSDRHRPYHPSSKKANPALQRQLRGMGYF